MKIVERRKPKDTLRANLRDERDALVRRVRMLIARNARAFDQGFEAATRMVEAGADAARLREAAGTVRAEWEDTNPIAVLPEDR